MSCPFTGRRYTECVRCLANIYFGPMFEGHLTKRNKPLCGRCGRECFVKRVTEGNSPGGPGRAAADEAFQESYPSLFDHLTAEKWDDDKPRTTSSVLIFCESGTWKAMLNNRAEGLVAFVTSHGFLALIDSLEHGLAEGQMDWRKSRSGGPTKK